MNDFFEIENTEMKRDLGKLEISFHFLRCFEGEVKFAIYIKDRENIFGAFLPLKEELF